MENVCLHAVETSSDLSMEVGVVGVQGGGGQSSLGYRPKVFLRPLIDKTQKCFYRFGA